MIKGIKNLLKKHRAGIYLFILAVYSIILLLGAVHEMSGGPR